MKGIFTSSGHTAEGKCPYHNLQASQTPASPETTQLGVLTEQLYHGLEAIKEKTGPFLPTTSRYIGEIRLHPSMFNQGEHYQQMPPVKHISAEKQTPLGRMIGNVHMAYRSAAGDLGEVLDFKRMSANTQAAVDDYKKLVSAYREEVDKTGDRKAGIKPSFRRLSQQDKDRFSDEIVEALGQLRESDLGKAAELPMLTADGPIRVKNATLNGEKLGLFLFAMKQSESTLIDDNKIPSPGGAFLTRTIGNQAEIIKYWRKMPDPALQAEAERISRKTYERAIAAIRKEPQALQMGHLLLQLANETQGTQAAAEMCGEHHAKIGAYPSALTTSLEAGAVAESIASLMPLSKQRERLETVANKLGDDKPMTKADTAAVIAALKGSQMAARETNEAVPVAQALLKGYMNQQCTPSHPRVTAISDTLRGV